jgi:hypothetical protein
MLALVIMCSKVHLIRVCLFIHSYVCANFVVRRILYDDTLLVGKSKFVTGVPECMSAGLCYSCSPRSYIFLYI